MKVSSYGPFVSGAESCVTMQVGAMPVQMLRATVLQARWCAVRSEQYEQQTAVRILPAVHRENDEADEVVSAVRRCPVVAACTSRRRGGDWALDALSRFAALPRSSIFHAAKPSCSARTSRIPRSHVRATPSRLFLSHTSLFAVSPPIAPVSSRIHHGRVEALLSAAAPVRPQCLRRHRCELPTLR